jgi:choloylglycine hydrolase
MCTAVSYQAGDHYFGRNLDLEYSYHETVAIVPRRYPLHFRKRPAMDTHYAMIGMATVVDGTPLFYEATNEKGLSMAGLNFPVSARYLPPEDGAVNIAPFEFIPWILGQCASADQAEEALKDLRLVDIPFSSSLPLTPLHWMICDRERSIIVEPMADGIRIFHDPVGVLTNEPPFDHHLSRLTDYMGLTPELPHDTFSRDLHLIPYSNGMGAMGLPGDFSSGSRYIRATFVKLNSVSADDPASGVSQFFHILSSVAMPRGCVRTERGHEITRYSSCCDTDRGIYYYTTYDAHQITGIQMFREDLDSTELSLYPIDDQPRIFMREPHKGR